MTGFSLAVKRIIIERASSWCERCALRPGVEAHHRRPRGAGGTKRESSNQPSNGLWLCRFCHNRCESMRAEALEYGWLVLQHQEPAEVPVLYRGTWYLLSDDGGLEIVEQIGA